MSTEEGHVGEVAVLGSRGGVEICWEPGDYQGPVVIKATNAENGDVGIINDDNDGKAFLTWPAGTYTDDIEVYKQSNPDAGPDLGDLIAKGTITVTIPAQ